MFVSFFHAHAGNKPKVAYDDAELFLRLANCRRRRRLSKLYFSTHRAPLSLGMRALSSGEQCLPIFDNDHPCANLDTLAHMFVKEANSL